MNEGVARVLCCRSKMMCGGMELGREGGREGRREEGREGGKERCSYTSVYNQWSNELSILGLHGF